MLEAELMVQPERTWYPLNRKLGRPQSWPWYFSLRWVIFATFVTCIESAKYVQEIQSELGYIAKKWDMEEIHYNVLP